jgi:hypothetical protein
MPPLTNSSPALLSLKVTQTGFQRYRLSLVAEEVSDLAGFQFELAFQPNLLEIISVTPGSLLETDEVPIYWKPPNWDGHHGQLLGAAAIRLSTSGVSHSGILASIDVRLKSSSLRSAQGQASIEQILPKLQNLVLVDSHANQIPTQLTIALATPLTTPPRETRLLRNYPNPFNPETWIPYHLSKTADVDIEIYDASGRLIRSLNLGIQPAGRYDERGRAAYWDGRNDAGELVSSGIYFYSLHAENFHATQKMILAK